MRNDDRLKPLWQECVGWAVRGGVAAFATCTLAVHLMSTSPNEVAEWTQWFLNRPIVFALFYLALGVPGLDFALVSRRWKHDGERVRKLIDYAVATYSGLAGALFGWTMTICTWAAIMDHHHVLPALGIMMLMTVIVAAPFFCHVVARVTIISMHGRLFVEPWRINVVRMGGLVMFALASVGAFHDLFVYSPAV